MIYGGRYRCLLCESWQSHIVMSDETLDCYGIELAKFAKRRMGGHLKSGKKLAMARIGGTYVATLSGLDTATFPSDDEFERLASEASNSYETPADGTQVTRFLDLQRELYDRSDGLPNISLISAYRFGRRVSLSMSGVDLYERAETGSRASRAPLGRFLEAADQERPWSRGHPCALPKLLQYIAEGCNSDRLPYTRDDRVKLRVVEVQFNGKDQDPAVVESCPTCHRFVPTLLCR